MQRLDKTMVKMQKPIENPSPWRLEVLRPKPLILHGKEEVPFGERGGMALPVAVDLMMTHSQEITRAELLQVFVAKAGSSLDRENLRGIFAGGAACVAIEAGTAGYRGKTGDGSASAGGF